METVCLLEWRSALELLQQQFSSASSELPLSGLLLKTCLKILKRKKKKKRLHVLSAYTNLVHIHTKHYDNGSESIQTSVMTGVPQECRNVCWDQCYLIPPLMAKGQSALSANLQMTPSWRVQLTHLKHGMPSRGIWPILRIVPKES